MARNILLVDGDEYLFKATAVVERDIKWDDQNHVLYANENESWDNFTRMLRQLGERLDNDEMVICFSGERPYFREELYPAYKGGRITRKPLCYAELRKRSEEAFICKSYPGIEADDCMGILATKPGPMHTNGPGEGPARRIIVSQDKDMLTVPGYLCRDGRELQYVQEADAEQAHFMQTLIGDRVDGYAGCPGVGEVTAKRLLEADKGTGLPWSWERVVAIFEQHKLTEADALVQARLARILQWRDWDYERKQPILWKP